MPTNKLSTEKMEDCFVIMPVTDPEGYTKGHFLRVYEDIFKPACKQAGFNPTRADEVKQTNLIHLDILQKLIEYPMAICDLSSRNPNVLFELGLRQAFDKPTVLVQEVNTPKIFDISPLRYTEYRKELGYRDVLEDQRQIARALEATAAASSQGAGVNSIVKILALSQPASFPEASTSDSADLLQIIRAEMSSMREEFRYVATRIGRERLTNDSPSFRSNQLRLFQADANRISLNVDNGMPIELALQEINKIQQNILAVLGSEVSDENQKHGMNIYDHLTKLEHKLTKRMAEYPSNWKIKKD